MSGGLHLADAETRRFGLRVARGGDAAGADALALADALVAQRIDVAILRLDAAECGAATRLAGCGLVPLHADTLSTWSIDLAQVREPRPLAGGGALRTATTADGEAIGRLVRRVFADYPNHYRANPLFDPAAAIEGYLEWALAHVGADDRTGWVHADGGVVAGLACASHDAGMGVASGNLHGVDPGHARRGIYAAMIAATLAHYAALGLRSFTIATQAGNLAVQRVWARLGLRPLRIEHTWHVNALAGRALAGEGVAVDTGLDAGEALRRAHAAAFGDAALSRLQLAVVRPGVALHRVATASAPRQAGGRQCSTLGLDADGRLVGWAVTDRIA